MNIQQLSESVQNDLDKTVMPEAIIETMKTIMQTVDKHAKELTRKDLWDFMHDQSLDDKIWDDVLVLRVCTLEDAIREAMVISACGSILADYVERAKL